jgi:hypothetical protein
MKGGTTADGFSMINAGIEHHGWLMKGRICAYQELSR